MGRLSVDLAVAPDLLEAMDRTGRKLLIDDDATPPARVAFLTRQVQESVAMTIRDADGVLCMVVGLHPGPGDEAAEAWFAPGPAMRANLRPCMVWWRNLLETIAGELAPVVVTAWTDPASVAGERLAAWLGFQPAGGDGVLSRWERRFGYD